MEDSRQKVFGVILPAGTWYFHDFYRAVLNTIQVTTVVKEFGIMLYAPSLRVEPDWEKFYDSACKIVDGFLVVSPPSNDKFLKEVSSRSPHKPVVVIFGRSPHFSSVCLDNKRAVLDAVNHLVKLGHKKIATITGPMRSCDGKERLEGYKEALKAHDIPLQDQYIYYGEFDKHWGREGMLKFLELRDRPTALFAANDEIALGALEAAEDKNIRVPEDMAIVGFDDIPSNLSPFRPMTTIRQPLEKITNEGIAMLSREIETGVQTKQEISLHGKLVIRRTCGGEGSSLED